MTRLISALILVLVSALSAEATTYFNAMPNQLSNLTTAQSAQVNANYAQIVSDGNTGNTTILANIAGLGTALPNGSIIAVNSGTCPPGWLPANGTQSTVDLRGVYIRGLDTGAGRDTGRVLASYQADAFKDHSHTLPATFRTSMSTASTVGGPAQGGFLATTANFTTATDSQGVVSGNTDVETRPDSVVYLYCQLVASQPVTTTYFHNIPVDFSNTKVVPSAVDVMSDYNQIVNDGNTAYNAIQTAVNNFTAVPSGAVMPFNQSSCPSGWKASDGTSSTVDLRGRFIDMAASGAVGGTTANTLGTHTNSLFSPSIPIMTSFVAIAVLNSAGNAVVASFFNTTTTTGLSSTGSSSSTETRPKNVALLYCQKN
jgi:hypothetical protein